MLQPSPLVSPLVVSADERLRRGAARRVADLRQRLQRSRCPADAAALAALLPELAPGPGRPLSGASYLALCRELRGLWRALLLAEARSLEGERLGRRELDALRDHLARLRPALARPLAILLREVPLDGDAADRLGALRALLEVRQTFVARLAAARPHWKR